jgi:hypothetical protein
MIEQSQPVTSSGRGRFRLPAYDRGVWRRWAVLTVLVFVPVGGLTGLLFGDPPNGEFDTALAWDSVSQLVGAIAIGVWLWVLPWTAIYFEQVNTRHRSQVSDRSDGKKPGFAIAITALVLGLFFTGPVALAVDFFAWRRISATRIRYARGAATAATAGFAGAVGLIAWLVSGPSHFPGL